METLLLPKRPTARLALPLLVFAAFLLGACGGGTVAQGPGGSAGGRSNEETATPDLDSGDPLVRDAETYAKDRGVSLEEAVQRLRLQEDLSLEGLDGALEANEQDTFAGLWIQHEPEYRFVALFTRDGEEAIRPYIEGKPWADIVEVRNGASATLAELKAEQDEAGRILRDLGIPADSGIRVQENRVNLRVADQARLDAALRKADTRLPEHVVVTEGGLAKPK